MTKRFLLVFFLLLHLSTIQVRVAVETANFTKEWYDKYWQNANIEDYKNETIRRQLKLLKQLGDAALSSADLVAVSLKIHISF